MENPEFDKALREKVQGSELPYDSAQWSLMADRLAMFNKVQPPIARRVLPFYHWATAAAAAFLVAAFIRNIAKEQKPLNISHQFTSAARATDKVDWQKVEKQEEEVSPVRLRPIKAYAFSAQRKNAGPLTSLDSASNTAETVIEKNRSGAVSSAYESTWKAGPLFKPRVDIITEDVALTPNPKTTTVDVIGGYNISTAKNNFTLGVTVKRTLGKKLKLETGLALVNGGYATHRSEVTDNGIGGMSTDYVSSTANLLYLQAAPTLNYQVYRGFSAGAGGDVQRLLSSTSKTTILDDQGKEIAPQPEWDFGLTGRMDYQLAKKLRAGMMYRESVRAISKSSATAAQRNYLLLQLSYTIL